MSSALTKGPEFVALAYRILQVVLCFIVCFLLVSLSLLKQPLQVHNNFSMQFPGKLQNLEFVLFVKLYSTGIASNISNLSIVCANESLGGSYTLSVFLA